MENEFTKNRFILILYLIVLDYFEKGGVVYFNGLSYKVVILCYYLSSEVFFKPGKMNLYI